MLYHTAMQNSKLQNGADHSLRLGRSDHVKTLRAKLKLCRHEVGNAAA